jgi:Leucine-rich repeat (LRR) protein
VNDGKADTGSVQEIENLETLTALEELWLGKNKIVEMKVRNCNPRYLDK